jgi:putative transposase
LRPPVAQGALELTADGKILLKMRRAWHGGTRVILFEPHELIERLAALVPKPRINLLLYHGVLGPSARLRSGAVAAAQALDLVDATLGISPAKDRASDRELPVTLGPAPPSGRGTNETGAAHGSVGGSPGAKSSRSTRSRSVGFSASTSPGRSPAFAMTQKERREARLDPIGGREEDRHLENRERPDLRAALRLVQAIGATLPRAAKLVARDPVANPSLEIGFDPTGGLALPPHLRLQRIDRRVLVSEAPGDGRLGFFPRRHFAPRPLILLATSEANLPCRRIVVL